MRPKTGITQVDSQARPIIGSDETGYGAWAGPLVVVAAHAPFDWYDPQVTDSKKLTKNRRLAIVRKYKDDDRFIIRRATVDPVDIDKVGVYQACLLAHAEAINKVAAELSDSFAIIDGNMATSQIATNISALSVPKADGLVPEVALASVFAKVVRDLWMAKLSKTHPGYGFERHQGYGTAMHKESLNRLGPCPIHRRSYRPVKNAAAAFEAVSKDDPPLWEMLGDELIGRPHP